MTVEIVVEYQPEYKLPWLAVAPMIARCYAWGLTEPEAIKALRAIIPMRLAGIENGVTVFSGGKHKTMRIEV